MTSPQEQAVPPVNISLGRLVALAILLPALFGTLYLWYAYVPGKHPDPPPELVILQLNDTYRLDAVHDANGQERGGLARVVALVRQLKEQNKHALILHAGDFLSPSLESEYFGGTQMVAALNYIHEIAPVYVVPGNHEFDQEKPHLLVEAIRRSGFKWLVSNLERNDPGVNQELSQRTSRSVVVPFGKLKVGIFALTLDAAHEGKDRDYAATAADYTAVAEAEIGRLESEGADLIIGLTRLDMPDDLKLARLRQKHPRFLWIAGGHEHYWQREAPSAESALVTKGDANARTTWKISVLMKDGRPELREERLDVGPAVKPDEKFQREVEEYYRSKLLQERPYLGKLIARFKETCYHASEDNVREEQSNWGSLIADSMRHAYSNVAADVAVLDGGAIRIDDNFCQEIRFEHLERSLTYESPVAYMKLSGKYLKEDLLEHSVAGKRGDGRFLQVSGLSFSFDPDQQEGRRVLDVKVQSRKAWEPLNENRSYIVAVTRHLLNCGDGYDFRKHITEYIEPGPDLRTLTYEALAASGGSVASDKEERIVSVPKSAFTLPERKGEWKQPTEADKVCR